MGKIPAILTAVAGAASVATSISALTQKGPKGPSQVLLAAQKKQQRSAIKKEAESRAQLAAQRRITEAGGLASVFGSAGRKGTFGE